MRTRTSYVGVLLVLAFPLAATSAAMAQDQWPAAGTDTPSPPGPAAADGTSLRIPGDWPRVHLPDPVEAVILRHALAEAFHQLAAPRCEALLDQFQDAAGRPLRARLETLDMDVQDYLQVIRFDAGTRLCREAIAYTAPGSRVVFLCHRAVERAWRESPEHLVATLIHEMLHTLGLGENPPSSAEITDRVLKRCGRQQAARTPKRRR